MKLTILPGQLDKIRGKLQKAQNNKKFFIQKYSWSLDLVKDYSRVVRSVMGSVEARGGYIHMTFLDKVSGQTYWKNLAPETLRRRAAKAGMSTPAGNKDPYNEYKWDFSIYKDTGDTKEAIVAIKDATSAFAGIVGGKAYMKALAMEEGKASNGKAMAPRKLFAVANFLFIAAVHNHLQDKESWLHKIIAGQFVQFMHDHAEWGSGPAHVNPFIH